jgi:hypothetical protein
MSSRHVALTVRSRNEGGAPGTAKGNRRAGSPWFAPVTGTGSKAVSFEWCTTKASQSAGKPNSVHRFSHLGVPARARRWRGSRCDDHSSRPAITRGLKQPTRWSRTGRPSGARIRAPAPPYLVLLRAGFCLPPTLPPARCALTAPFHPYLPIHPQRGKSSGGIFSVPLVRQVTLPGRYPAHCPAEFGLSSPPGTTRERGYREQRSSGRLRHDHYRTSPSASWVMPYCSSFL